MASERPTLRIGYVPEHYLTPLHLALSTKAESLPYVLQPIPFPSGTGHMITSLRTGTIDLAIGLTEGWVAGLVGKQAPPAAEAGGYKVVGSWVETPLRWAIVTGRDRDGIREVGDLVAASGSGPGGNEGKGKGRVGVSRLGSGSHIMSFVLAQREGWDAANGDDGKSLEPVVLGPFANLRDGVCAKTSSGGGGEAQADFFMWEHFTTKPFFQAKAGSSGTGKEEVPLKKIGEIFTPWPSWMIVASNTVFPDPANDERLSRLFEVLDEGIGAFRRDTERVVSLLGSGELGCHYGEEDAREWLKDVRFAEGTRGVDGEVIGGVVDVLKVAGVIDEGVERGDAVQRVVGVKRG